MSDTTELLIRTKPALVPQRRTPTLARLRGAAWLAGLIGGGVAGVVLQAVAS